MQDGISARSVVACRQVAVDIVDVGYLTAITARLEISSKPEGTLVVDQIQDVGQAGLITEAPEFRSTIVGVVIVAALQLTDLTAAAANPQAYNKLIYSR